jgi:hypothetical protein
VINPLISGAEMRLGVLSILGVVLAIALAVAIPAMRGDPQVRPADNSGIEEEIAAVEAPPVTPLQPLLDLIAAGKIEASVTGSSIESVTLHLRNLSPEAQRVYVPAGTFFASNRASAQSMVATRGSEYDVQAGQEISVTIDTACANLPLDIPDSGNTFSIAQAPPNPDLALVAPHLANETYDVKQAAVWIITDDADFDELGILVTGSGYSDFNMRVIDEYDAARAMQLLQSAGIDLRTRSIWHDRAHLSEYLPEGELKTWLDAL